MRLHPASTHQESNIDDGLAPVLALVAGWSHEVEVAQRRGDTEGRVLRGIGGKCARLELRKAFLDGAAVQERHAALDLEE